MNTYMICNSDQLHRYHDAELSPAELREVETHLASCDACCALLDDLRGMSQWIASAQMPAVETVRLNAIAHSAWHASSDRGVRRLAGWITAVAAAVMVFALLDVPSEHSNGNFNGNSQAAVTGSIAVAADWEQAAIMPPGAMTLSDDGDRDLVKFAQWMTSDLDVDAEHPQQR